MKTLEEIYQKYPFLEKLTSDECMIIVAEILVLLMKISMGKSSSENYLDNSFIGILKDIVELKNKIT